MQKEIKVLVLGHNGLLGNMVERYLNDSNVVTTMINEYRWPSENFKNSVINSGADYIVNCIGAIHQKTSDFSINTDLPIWLDQNSGCRVIHPGTDCEMDSDAYGISKKIASDYLKEGGSNTKIIKTSIIGPELKTSYSLMNWFLNNPDGCEVKGFVNHMWNGNTTLTWAQNCLLIITQWDYFGSETIIASECVSKYELLLAINEIYGRNVRIMRDDRSGPNKCLIGQIKTKHIREQLKDLKRYVG